jgi:hypothetical protein
MCIMIYEYGQSVFVSSRMPGECNILFLFAKPQKNESPATPLADVRTKPDLARLTSNAVLVDELSS